MLGWVISSMHGRGAGWLAQAVDHVLALEAEHVHGHLAWDELDAHRLAGLEQLGRLGHVVLLDSVPIIHGPMPRKFIFESFRWSMPGRCMSDSIFCIQFSPTMRCGP